MLCIWFAAMAVATAVHARPTSVRGHELVFNATETHGRSLGESASSDLWYVRSGSVPPPGCVSETEAVAPGVYLARGDGSAGLPRGRWTPEMKYNPAMRTFAPPRFPLFGVQVRTDDAFFEFGSGCATELASQGRFYVSCPTPRLEDVAKDERVLWISEIPVMRFHSLAARNTMLGGENLNGSGILIAISDTGLDWKHGAFYEGSAPPLGSVSSSRVKVVGILKVSGADYIALTGAHGSATAGAAAGEKTSSTRSGVAPKAKLWILDNSIDDRTVYVPSNFESLILNSGASAHSASWGSYSGGEYSDMDARFDSMERTNPYLCHTRSAGNDGPYEIVSAASKNALVIAACLNHADDYPEFSASQRASNPELYSYTSQIDFSSKGPAADGRLSPHLCAKGYKVWAPYALNPSTTNHASYAKFSGTSLSCPLIVAMIANLQQKYKNENNGALPLCSLIQATLMAHAVKPTRVVRPVGDTLQIVADAPAISTLGVPILKFNRFTQVVGSVTSSTRQAFCFENLADAEPYTIVLRWTDVAGIEGSSAPLINDLDMIVTGALGTTKVQDDEINSFEMLSGWTAQNTRIVVMAYNDVTTFGAQAFAIHIQGKARVVDCTSSVLPSELTASCPGETGAYAAVSSWLGATSCDYRTCPTNTCGADCARTCTSTLCASGTGALDAGGACRPKSCPEYTFVTDTECKCRVGTARPCDNGQVSTCLESGVFAACPESTSASIQAPPAPASSDASVAVLSVYGIFIVASSALALLW